MATCAGAIAARTWYCSAVLFFEFGYEPMDTVLYLLSQSLLGIPEVPIPTRNFR